MRTTSTTPMLAEILTIQHKFSPVLHGERGYSAMALGVYNEKLLQGASTSLQQVKSWLSGRTTGNITLPAKPRLLDIDRLGVDNDDTVSGVALQVTTDITSGGPALDIAAAALTSATALDISGLAAITSGKGLHVAASGITQTTGVLTHIETASTGLTGAGRALLVDATGDFNDVSGIVSEIKSVHTTGVGLQLTMDAITDGFGVDGTFDGLTSGEALRIVSSSTGLTTNGRLFHLNASGDFDDAGGIVAEIESAHTTGEGFNLTVDSMTDGFGQRITADGLTTGTALIVESTSSVQTTSKLLDIDETVSGDSISARTGPMSSFDVSRTETRTTGTTADDFDVLSLSRTSIMNGAGGTLTSGGSVLKLENVATQTAGTLTDSAKVLELVQDVDSTGSVVHSTNASTSNDLELINTNTGALGPKIELYHNPGNAQAADDDVVGRLRFQADDEEASATKRQTFSLEVQWTDATAASYASDLEVYLATAAASNLAMTLSGGGQLGVDLDSDLSASSAGSQIFDDYDDAMELQSFARIGVDRPEITQETIHRLEAMGIVFRHPGNQTGYLLKLQPFLRLLCGGIYQTRFQMEAEIERLEDELEKLGSTIEGLKAA
jgi:hypothetical protein